MSVEPRSWLFIPGDSEKKLSKASDCGADAVIIDLEDSVALAAKSDARAMTADYLRTSDRSGPALWVRINPLGTEECEADVAALVGLRPAGLVLPKCEGPEDVERLAALMVQAGGAPDIAVHAIATETARAVFRLAGFAERRVERLAAISWGAEDLAAAVGASGNRHADGAFHDLFRHVRSLALLAARAAGVQPVDTLHADFRDTEGLKASSVRARAEGFTGRLAIHPAQVATINDAFMPTAEEIDWAGRIVAAFAAAPDAGTIGIDGKMVDRPHLAQANSVLARAARLT
jgi:citrate lyase subunit beta/citryl-CoA lyase